MNRCLNIRCRREIPTNVAGYCEDCLPLVQPELTDDEFIAKMQILHPNSKITMRKARGAFGMTRIIEIKDPEYVKTVGEAPHCQTCRCGRI